MKHKIFLFLVIILSYPGISIAQKVTLNFQQAKLEDIFSSITKQTGYTFAYSQPTVNVNKTLSISVSDTELSQALKQLFEGLDIVFEVVDKKIFLSAKNSPVAPATTSKEKSKEVALKGIIQDAKGEAIIGATVKVKDSKTATVTDIDGSFSINAPANSILTVSYMGYVSQEVNLGGKTDVKIVLQEDTKLLDEVVVVGFGTQKKINLTGSVAVATSKDLADRPTVRLSESLQGMVPGLLINSQGGSLENKQKIEIRGAATIGDGSSGGPLVLIDGMEGDINSINPQDVDNISVLKDASSSSIYGSRAPFGVILITTKSGKSGKISLNYNNNFRFNTPMNKPNMLDSYTFATYFNHALLNGRQNPHFTDEHLQRIKDFQEGKITTTIISNPNNPNNWGDGYRYGNDNINWYDAVYKDSSSSQEHNLSISGGNDIVNYYASVNFLNQNGLMKLAKDKYDRFTTTGKANIKINNWAKFSYNTRFTREDYVRPSDMTSSLYYDLARQGWPTLPLYDPNGYLYSSPSPGLKLATGGKDAVVTDNLYQQASIILEPVKKWVTSFNLNYRTYTENRHWDLLQTYNHNVKGEPYLNRSNSEVYEYNKKDNYINLNIVSDYSLQIASKHNLNSKFGFQAEEFKNFKFSAKRDGIIVPGLPEIDLTSGMSPNGDVISPAVEGSRGNWSVAGFFGRLNYDYDGKYLAEVNLRYDGTSRFMRDQRWNWFPSFSLGWNIAREEFWKPISSTVETLKIRFTYGELGNQNTSSLYPTYSSMNVNSMNGLWLINGIKPNTASRPSLISRILGWERIKSQDMAFDFGLLNNRLTGSFEYFVRKTLDMVGPAPELPNILGMTEPKTNNTDLKTYGFDFNISWRDRLRNGLGYGLKFILSDSQTEITRFPNEAGLISTEDNGTVKLATYRTGMKMGEIWGYETIGIAKTQQEMDAHLASLSKGGQSALGSDWSAGDIMYKDLNSDGAINSGSSTVNDPGDRKIIGNITPRYNFGFEASADWRNFDFKAFFQGVMKRDYFQESYYFWGAATNIWFSTGFKEHLDYFRSEDYNHLKVNVDSYYPRPLFNDKNKRVQTRYLQDASYIRLKNIQLGYNIPSRLLNKANIANLRIYVSGENLWTGTKMAKMFDPETVGISYGNGYPLSKTLSFGLSITL